MRLHKHPGFTLIEMVITILLGGMILYSLLITFMVAGQQNYRKENVAVAAFLAESKLEEVSSRLFSTITSEVKSAFGTNFNGFSYAVKVYYVTGEALDTNLGTIVSNYKRVAVQVFSPGVTTGSLEIVTLVTNVSNR